MDKCETCATDLRAGKQGEAIGTAADIPIPTEGLPAFPEIQTISGYIRRHFEGAMIAELAAMLESGRIAVRLNHKIVYCGRPGQADGNTPPRMGPADCRKQEMRPIISVQGGAIHRICLRRVGYNMVNAGLTIAMDLKITPAQGRPDESALQWYRANIWIDMESGIAGDYGRFRIYRFEAPEEGIPLDDYLVPVLNRDGIDEEAERIFSQLKARQPDGAPNLQAGQLAAMLGLQVKELALCNRPKTSSILFFEAGDVFVQAEDAPVSIRIEPDTIVLNRNSRCHSSGKDAVFHECFHYIEHRLFFQLQRMRSSDLCPTPAQISGETERSGLSPIDWMEWQAQYGSQCLQMPRSLLQRRIREELSEMKCLQAHMGDKLQLIGRKLAREFEVPNYRMRNRMIHVGYGAARGALNFVDGGYIRPFAFKLSACHGSKTFVVGMRDVLREYLRSEVFRRMIDSERYIYVDGHLCLKDSAYVVCKNKRVCMTLWANRHADQCCLRFAIVYTQDKRTRYIYGQLNSDEEYNARNLSLSLSESGASAMECARAMAQTLTELPGSFSGALRAHMERCAVTIEELSARTGLSIRTVNRLRNEDRAAYALNQVVLICLGLHLPPEFSMDMIEKSGLRLRNRPEDLIYGAILRTMYLEPIENVQTLLRQCGCPELPMKEVG